MRECACVYAYERVCARACLVSACMLACVIVCDCINAVYSGDVIVFEFGAVSAIETSSSS